MGMTLEQKKKCVDLWKGYTETDTEPHWWNEEAAGYLAEYIGEVIKCTHGLKMFEAVFPKFPKKLGWIDLLRIPDKLIRAHMGFKHEIAKGYVNGVCLSSKTLMYRTIIEAAIVDGLK